MNMTHPDILEAERHGLASDEPAMTSCENCERTVETSLIYACEHCGREICTFCLYTNDFFMEHFCGEEFTLSSDEPLIVPCDCYHEWCLDNICKLQDEVIKLKQEMKAA